MNFQQTIKGISIFLDQMCKHEQNQKENNRTQLNQIPLANEYLFNENPLLLALYMSTTLACNLLWKGISTRLLN